MLSGLTRLMEAQSGLIDFAPLYTVAILMEWNKLPNSIRLIAVLINLLGLYAIWLVRT